MVVTHGGVFGALEVAFGHEHRTITNCEGIALEA
jgi:hypothetical protein